MCSCFEFCFWFYYYGLSCSEGYAVYIKKKKHNKNTIQMNRNQITKRKCRRNYKKKLPLARCTRYSCLYITGLANGTLGSMLYTIVQADIYFYLRGLKIMDGFLFQQKLYSVKYVGGIDFLWLH